jgi:hypothetical protein
MSRPWVRGAALAAMALLVLPALSSAATAPKPVILSGSGSKVVVLRVARTQPLVLTSVNSGSSNFIVDVVGAGGTHNLVNEIGSYNGQTLWPEATSGKYRVSVEADGAWTLRFTQPVPSNRATRIPRTLKGVGSRVVSIRTLAKTQPTVTGANTGTSNFIVDVVGYGNTQGDENLFNEIAPYHGQTISDSALPSGGYLLWVVAEGPWTISFSS